MKAINVILLILLISPSYSQLVYYQDTFQGGVSVIGMSTSSAVGFQNFNINIAENSQIKEVFVVAHSRYSDFFEMSSYTFYINSAPITLDVNTDYSFEVLNNILPFHVVGHRIYVKRITDIVNISNNQVSVNWPEYQITLPANCPGCGFSAPLVVIIYENTVLPTVNFTMVINRNPNQHDGSIIFNNLNVINPGLDVVMGIHCDRVGGNPNDGYEFFLNGTSLGIVNEPDISSLASGVIGTFEYYDETFFGLTDDVPNDTFSGSDAILRLNNYMTGSSLNGMQLSYNYLLPPNSPHNYFNTICLAYTSPCQPFGATLLTSDTATCTNIPVQLGITVPDTIKAAYEWLPQTNLSCYDCPNPVFLGDSTINYTVRIWASDSCSKVLPVRVRVFPQPSFESVDVTENICGFEVGAIVGASSGLSLPHSYQINNSTPQNDFNFSNLEADIYTITVTDGNGCSRDSTVQILEVNDVQAAFSVNPSSGAAPLTVQTQNTSQNATEYQWFWGDEGSTLQNPSITLDTAGVYTLTLVASNGAAHCNDTTSALIFVEEPFVVFAYSYVTDEADVYQIFLSGVSEYEYKIYALDGKLVYQKNGNIEAAGYVDLWEISGVASGMYVFRVRVKDNAGNENEVEGKVVVVR